MVMYTSKKEKKEVKYLKNKETIKLFLENAGHEDVLRYMIEELDNIENINNTQSVYLFQIISALETALEIYPRIQNA